MTSSRRAVLYGTILVFVLSAGIIGTARQQPSGPAPGTVTRVTALTFEEAVVHSPRPVFVYVEGGACRPCDDQLPLVEELARTFRDIRFVRFDAVVEPGLANTLKVSAVPTHFVIKLDEKTVFYNEGFLDRESLREFIVDGLAQRPGNKTLFEREKDRKRQELDAELDEIFKRNTIDDKNH